MHEKYFMRLCFNHNWIIKTLIYLMIYFTFHFYETLMG